MKRMTRLNVVVARYGAYYVGEFDYCQFYGFTAMRKDWLI